MPPLRWKGCNGLLDMKRFSSLDKEKSKIFQTWAWKTKKPWYIKNPLRVKCAGCLKDRWSIQRWIKNWKILKTLLEKIKIGDILRIRCVLSATRLLDKLPRSVQNKKLKNFQSWAWQIKNRWYIKKLLLQNGVSWLKIE